MKRTKYQQAMDDIHCPIELIEQIQQQKQQIQQQTKLMSHLSETNDYYIYRYGKKPYLCYAFKVAVFITFFIPIILLIQLFYQSSNHENPIPSVQDENVKENNNHFTEDNQDKTNLSTMDDDKDKTNLSTTDDEIEFDQQELNSFITKNYPDFEWSRKKKEDGTYFELWNEKNELRITINNSSDIALIEHNGINMKLTLPYGFISTPGTGTTAMYLQDTIGNGEEQLVVISSVTGTRYTTWNLDIYNLTTMTQIPIKEDVPWVASQIDLDILSYYDEHITYTLTVPDSTTYLMSDYVGELDEVYMDDLKYNPLSVLTNGIDEITDYTLAEEDLEQKVYELKKDEPGLRITYSVTPYFMRGPVYSGEIVTDYVFDGEQFVLERDSLNYLQPNANRKELIVDAKDYQCTKNDISTYKFSTWYLSGIDQSSNCLLIQLMKKAKETPWVIDATILANGTKIPLKQLQNKSNIKVLWSITGDCFVISYQDIQPLPAYDKETFFVYDLSENKVVYEDALTFAAMEEAFQKQGIYFMAHPSRGEARESFNVINVDERDKLLSVEYSFIDQNNYQRQGSFTYNYETNEYSNLAKNYQELTDQFNYWDNQVIGEDYKKVIITNLVEELSKQKELDIKMLSYLTPFLKVIQKEEFSLIEYRENPEFYGRSASGSYLIAWKPGYAKVIDENGNIYLEDIVRLKEKEYLIIAYNYLFSNKQGIRLIRFLDSTNEDGIVTSNVVPDDLPQGFSFFNDSIYSDTGTLRYTVEGSTILFHNGKNEYRMDVN